MAILVDAAGAGGRPASFDASTAEAGAPRDSGLNHEDAGPRDAGGSVTLSGALQISSQLFVDSDVGDPDRVPTPNDDIQHAQRVASPALVGGYLGQTPRGPDQADVYSVDLAAGETATLYIAQAAGAATFPDFDLFLDDANGTQVDASQGSGRIELVTASREGTYFVRVSGVAGAGIYTLALASAPSAQALRVAATSRLAAAWRFVPGEALVKLRPRASAASSVFAGLGVRPISRRTNALGYRRVALVPKVGPRQLSGTAVAPDAATTIAAIKRLRKRPEVLYAEPNYVRRASAVPPNDPLFTYQWHYRDISLLDAWDHSKGTGAIVAVLDSGVKKAHPDFANPDASSQLLPGYDMISDPTAAADGDGRDSDPDDPGDRELVTDSSWHGTHVAGTIAAATDNGIGCASVAPGAKILPVRVLGVGGGNVDDIVQAILYAAGLPNDAGVLPAKRADVINLSLAGAGLSQATADAVAAARGAGAIVVAAAGNDHADASFQSPAAEVGVVAVSATDYLQALAPYSNFGSVIDVAGPGGDEATDRNGDGLPDGVMSLVYANGGGNLYTGYQGTSMATAHVAGVAALMKSLNPALSPDDFDSMLAGTSPFGTVTQDLGPVGRDDSFGTGLINANLAVLAALESASLPTTNAPALALSSISLDFGAIDDTRVFDVTNVGRGLLSISSVTADQPWLSVAPGALGANTITVDRSGLAPGIYTGTITVTSNAGTKTLSVRARVAPPGSVSGGDVGSVYVILVDPKTHAGVAQAVANFQNGYAFTFPIVPSGDYELAAGTDLDGNLLIDDEGEAFGAWPVTSGPQLLHVTANGVERPGLDFPIRFRFDVLAASVATAGQTGRQTGHLARTR